MDKQSSQHLIIEKTEIAICFGENVAKYRKALNLSQEKFGEIIGFHRAYVGTIERGEKSLDLDSVEKIAKALGIDPKELFNFENLQ